MKDNTDVSIRNDNPSAWTMGDENHIWMQPEQEERLVRLHLK